MEYLCLKNLCFMFIEKIIFLFGKKKIIMKEEIYMYMFVNYLLNGIIHFWPYYNENWY